MIVGEYVTTFAEASHALPSGMHMNADYPFMIPLITKIERGKVTIRGRGGVTATFAIKKGADGKEFGHILQSSSFERMFAYPPQEFMMLPFKDEKTPIPGPTEDVE